MTNRCGPQVLPAHAGMNLVGHIGPISLRDTQEPCVMGKIIVLPVRGDIVSEILAHPDVMKAPRPRSKRRHRMQARTGQRKRVWGPPTTLRAHLASVGRSPTPGKGPFVFARSPTESWSTERLEDYVATLYAEIADGADPALLAPHINSANAILEKRGAPKDHGIAESAGTDTAPER